MPFTHLDIGGPVATLSLDDAGGNQINFDMRVELRDAVQRIEKSPARALLIRSEGGDFCLGGDVHDWPGIPTETLRAKIQVLAEALDHLERLPIPTVAAVQGGCIGGGFELALSCDLILAAKSARFALSEARVGSVPLQGGMMQIAERVGRAKARRDRVPFRAGDCRTDAAVGRGQLGRRRRRVRVASRRAGHPPRRRTDKSVRCDQGALAYAGRGGR
jgi:enoyl-CoA hydratase/carnithine racemase